MEPLGRVVVLGSINLDVQVDVLAFPRPGETIHGLGVREGLGGKGANQAVAAARAGGRAVLIGKVGRDGAARRLLADAAPSLDIGGVEIDRDTASGAAYILVSPDGENQIVVVAGANARVADHGAFAIARGDVCLAQLEIPVAAVERFFAAARAAGARTVLNTAPAAEPARALLPLADVVVLNETELAFFGGGGGTDRETLATTAGALSSHPDQTIVVTLGAAGALVVDAAGHRHVPGRRAEPVDTTGAGDCFCGVLCAALAAGTDMPAAVERANAAAALQVERRGAADAMPDAAEIDAVC